MSDDDRKEFMLAFHDQCCAEGGECRSRSIHSWTYGWFDGERYLDALPASLLRASLDGRTQAGSDARTATTECPACHRSAQHCSDSAARGRDGCCMRCDETGRTDNHRMRMVPIADLAKARKGTS